MKGNEPDTHYSERETDNRRNAALKRALNTPPSPHLPTKKKVNRVKTRTSKKPSR
jgi:hypothetical protein